MGPLFRLRGTCPMVYFYWARPVVLTGRPLFLRSDSYHANMDSIIGILHFLWILFLVIMVFNFMIIVHEWGHFLAARWRGLKIDKFQIWFGKPI